MNRLSFVYLYVQESLGLFHLFIYIFDFLLFRISVSKREDACEYLFYSEYGFYFCSQRNNVVILFGTLEVQSFIITEVSDCGLLIVVTSSFFFRRKDMLKEQKAISPDQQNL